jgi:hypothetical protein
MRGRTWKRWSMPRSVAEYLQHILDEIVYLQSAARGVTWEEFDT